jgi:hypothetical protein
MASVPQGWMEEDDEGAGFEPKPGHRLPGWTVDALLEEGKIDEARAELENLIVAGVNSGPVRTMDEEWLNGMIAKAKSRARRATR